MRTNGHGLPVVALDIDGTLGDYHSNFLRFASLYLNKRMPILSDNPGLPLHEFIGISKERYREAKLAYRQGGWKRWMPAYDNAAGLTEMIRNAWGAEVWLCTTRPYLRLDNIDPDTREWLSRNGIHYDAIIFDRVDEKGSKYSELQRQAGDRVASIMEDLPELIEPATKLFTTITPILRDQPYNRQIEWPRRVHNLYRAAIEIHNDIDLWRERHA